MGVGRPKYIIIGGIGAVAGTILYRYYSERGGQMFLYEILLISIGLSMDVFAYCLYKGAMISRFDRGNVIKTCALFTGFQMGMLVVGSLVRLIPPIQEYYEKAETFWMIVSALIFLGLGAYMLIRAFRGRNQKITEKREDVFNYKEITIWCVITGIDALIAGIGFGIMSVSYFIMLLVIGIASALAVLIGLFVGYRVGCYAKNVFLTLGGCIVVAGGVDIVIRYLV